MSYRKPTPKSKAAVKATRFTKAKRRWWAGFTRDLALFITGLALIVNEVAFKTGPERPYILTLLAGMVGLPTFLMAKRAGEYPSEDDE